MSVTGNKQDLVYVGPQDQQLPAADILVVVDGDTTPTRLGTALTGGGGDVPSAGPLTGTEVIRFTQDGEEVEGTTQDIADLGGGGLAGFTASLNTTAPNNTVNASQLVASGGTTDQDVVISPKGEGASFQSQLADGTAAGGNKRGVGAVDFQTNRNNADEVADGDYSFVAGNNNKATGQSSFAAGQGNLASGIQSFVAGSGNIASGDRSVALGATTQATSSGAFASGQETIADGLNSRAAGYQSTTRDIELADVFGGDNGTAIVGTNQRGDYILQATTANNTPTVLSIIINTVDATTQITLPNNASYKFTGQVVAVDKATGNTSGWDFSGTIKRAANAASTALLSAITPTPDSGNELAGASVAVTADTTIGCIKVAATGIAATDIEWSCRVPTIERTYTP